MTTGEILEITLLTVKVSATATLLIAPAGIALGYVLARRRFAGRAIAQALISLPMVLPPVAIGLLLLHLLARDGVLGKAAAATFGGPILLTWWAAAIASAVMSFPLLVRGAEQGFAAVPRRLESVARTLGASRSRVFLAITLPLASRGILYGLGFAFARGLGEYGATTVVAGHIPGKTETLALGIYARIHDFNDADAVILSCVSVVLAFLITGAAEIFLQDRDA
ncbi:MAG: molybdate ABC transporter permease subunit [Planctomycetota bacterium]